MSEIIRLSEPCYDLPIGTRFKIDTYDETFEVCDSDGFDYCCSDCVFSHNDCYFLKCAAFERSDGKSVFFKEVTEEKESNDEVEF